VSNRIEQIGTRSGTHLRAGIEAGITNPVLSTATLTEKGLLATVDVFAVAAILSFTAGLLAGRWRALVAGPALAALAVAGIAAGWWGAGVGDRWQVALAWLAFLGAVLAAIGVSIGLVVRRLRALDTLWRASVAAAALLGILGYGLVATKPPDVDHIQARAASTLYYLGDSFEGYRLTDAEHWEGHALFAYGGCDREFGLLGEGGCSVPLTVQETFNPGQGPATCGPPLGPPRRKPASQDPAAVLVFAGSTMIEIYAHDRARARRAANALRPVLGSCP
jgi:hypothetical protein